MHVDNNTAMVKFLKVLWRYPDSVLAVYSTFTSPAARAVPILLHIQYVPYQVLLPSTLIRTLHPRLVHVLHFEHQKRADTYLSFSAAREGCDSLDWQICWQEGCNCQKLR